MMRRHILHETERVHIDGFTRTWVTLTADRAKWSQDTLPVVSLATSTDICGRIAKKICKVRQSLMIWSGF